MAAGQLSPFPSCASGLGFLNSSDCRSAASLLTPAASICTVSSLSHAAGDISDSGYSRVRTKTMQTKEILKSPQPHRFHLVPTTGRRRTPSGPGMSSRPSAQLRDAWATDVPAASPGSFEHDDNIAERDGTNLFFPLQNPLMPPAETDNPPYSPQSPCAQTDSPYTNEHEQLSPYTIQSPAFSNTSRPTSTGSALSVLTASASFTLVHDRGMERASCSSVEKGTFDKQYRKDSLVDERPFTTVFALPKEPDSPSLNVDNHELSTQSVEAQAEIDMVVVESPLADASFPIILPDTSISDVGEQADAPHTTSTSLDSLLSKYRPTSDYIDDDMLSTADSPVANNLHPASLPTPVSIPLAQPIPAITSTSASPTKPPAAARDRRKFALRRQAIYAEYGFQIALPDSDSDSSVKFLASSPGTKGRAGQGRAASAYVKFPASHSGRSHSALSASASRASSADDYFHHDHAAHESGAGLDGEDEDDMQLFRSAHFNDVDRFGRFSVQDSILGATRIPRLDDFADVTTSTPPRSARSRAAGHHSLGTGLGLGLGSSPGSHTGAGSGCDLDLASDCSLSLGLGSGLGSGSGSGMHLSVTTSAIWQPGHSAPYVPSAAPQPLRPTPSQKRRARESTCLPVSASERSARLSAWDFDPGHHPIVQDLLDEVDRALEQWRWIMKMRSYV